ncbi:MAG: hypothetical protein ILP17_10965 [Lachnospiraceae bacterium]|nr:hypothetical protein [Lachnospiraceae bacterium]
MKRGTVPCFIIIYSALGHLLPHSVKHRLSLTDLCHPYQQNIHSILLPEDLNLGTDVGLVYGMLDLADLPVELFKCFRYLPVIVIRDHRILIRRRRIEHGFLLFVDPVLLFLV